MKCWQNIFVIHDIPFLKFKKACCLQNEATGFFKFLYNKKTQSYLTLSFKEVPPGFEPGIEVLQTPEKILGTR